MLRSMADPFELNVTSLSDPIREKAKEQSPQALLVCKYKNNTSAKNSQSARGGYSKIKKSNVRFFPRLKDRHLHRGMEPVFPAFHDRQMRPASLDGSARSWCGWSGHPCHHTAPACGHASAADVPAPSTDTATKASPQSLWGSSPAACSCSSVTPACCIRQGSAFPYPPPGRQAVPFPAFASATPA